jgi:peptidoglycan-N-acetylglucosamine deacetylase
MAAAKPLASLSLDLDNLWSYMKTHGDPGWEDLPSYLDLVVPRVLSFLKKRGVHITFFIVGQDAALERNRSALATIVRAGHEVGNHSFAHEPWLHLYEPAELEREVASAEDAIEAVIGQRPAGFRGPGYSLSAATLRVLKRRGYRYDASTFPTFLGPLARAYYFATAKLSVEQRAERAALFGGVREGLRPTGAYRWDLPGGALLEIPVTTLPGLKLPFHASYLLYLAGYSPAAARAYFRLALRACRAAGVQPSLLLHPLDFLGRDDLDALAFFPGMNQPAARKLAWLAGFLDEFERAFEVVPLGRHAEALEATPDLPLRAPSFATRPPRPSRRMLRTSGSSQQEDAR